MLFAIWSFDLCVTVFFMGGGTMLYLAFCGARKVARSDDVVSTAIKRGATKKALGLIGKWLE